MNKTIPAIGKASTSIKTTRGRPKANVFTSHRRKKGELTGGGAPNLPAYRALYLGMHGNWTTNPIYSDRLRSIRLRKSNDPDWEHYRAAEMSMLLRGRKFPEKHDGRPGVQDKFMTTDYEAYDFLRWIRNEVSRNWIRRPGQKPDPVKIYKTVLSAAVARYLIQPKGGNWKVKPSPREISQVWYVLFGETESDQSIKSRLNLTARLCVQYDKEFVTYTNPRRPRYIGRLGKALLGEQGVRKTKNTA